MLEMTERNAVIQNLQDAGCSEKFVEYFLDCYDRKETEGQMKLLYTQRKDLLERVHEEEKKISCLDYLIYQLKKTQV